ncbi:MAG: hypothetical protein IJW92_10035, partial [Clostridia bacterium]|nr:hypothetical protein [Clostridia bacterium]
VWFWSLPSWCKDLDNASFMMEIMAQYSHRENSTMDVCLESAISLAGEKDGNSREMLEIVRKSLVYDVALLYDMEWGGWRTAIDTIATSPGAENPVTAQFGTENENLVAARAAIEETVKLFQNPSINN